MKYLIIAFALIFNLQKYDGFYKVTKIDSGIIFIEKNNFKGLITTTNANLKISKDFVKIEVGKEYYFELKLYPPAREADSGFGVIESNGLYREIWNVKQNGDMYLFDCKNVNGLMIKEINK